MPSANTDLAMCELQSRISDSGPVTYIHPGGQTPTGCTGLSPRRLVYVRLGGSEASNASRMGSYTSGASEDRLL